MRKSMSLVIQSSFRALGQMQVKWQTFEKSENKRQMYGSRAWMADYHTFVSYFRGFQMSTILRVCPTAPKLGCITNFDTLFLVMGFISLVIEIQFMLIRSHHILNRSISAVLKIKCK